jgi:hypothetical protein
MKGKSEVKTALQDKKMFVFSVDQMISAGKIPT